MTPLKTTLLALTLVFGLIGGSVLLLKSFVGSAEAASSSGVRIEVLVGTTGVDHLVRFTNTNDDKICTASVAFTHEIERNWDLPTVKERSFSSPPIFAGAEYITGHDGLYTLDESDWDAAAKDTASWRRFDPRRLDVNDVNCVG